jgi:3-dehydroquinate synthase
MKTVTVSASKTYDIKIGSGLLATLGEEAAALGKAKNICIISDSNVWPLYGEAAKTSLESAGFSVTSFVFPAWE